MQQHALARCLSHQPPAWSSAAHALLGRLPPLCAADMAALQLPSAPMTQASPECGCSAGDQHAPGREQPPQTATAQFQPAGQQQEQQLQPAVQQQKQQQRLRRWQSASQQQQQPQQQQQGFTQEQCNFMRLAFELARVALEEREVPIGCVFVRDGEVIGTGSNKTNHSRNATRHAELEAVDRILQEHGGDVAKVEFDRCQLYVTIEPCIMCAGALSLLGVGEVFFGAGNDKFGGCGSIMPIHEMACGNCSSSASVPTAPHGKPFVARGGLFADEAIALLQAFYIAGNPAAPKPHRPVLDVPPWKQQQQPAVWPSAAAAGVAEEEEQQQQQQAAEQAPEQAPEQALELLAAVVGR